MSNQQQLIFVETLWNKMWRNVDLPACLADVETIFSWWNHWTSKAKNKFSDFEKISEWWRKLKLSDNAYTSEHSELSAMTENSFGMFLSCLTADVTTTYYSNSTIEYF